MINCEVNSAKEAEFWKVQAEVISLILHPEKGINDFPTDGHIHFTMITWFFAQYAFNKVMEKKAAEPVKPKEPPPMPTEWCLE